MKNRRKEFGNLEVVVLVILTSLISIGMTCCLFYKGLLRTPSDNHDVEGVIALTDEMKNFVDNYNYFIENYYGDVNEKELLEAAFEAMIKAAGDDFTNYIDEKATEQFNILINGSFVGFGVEIGRSDGDVYIPIIRVYPNSPASKAGLLAGDLITSINGIDTSDKTTDEFRNIVKSNTSDEFTLTYKRDGVSNTITIKRGTVEIESVHSSIKEVNNKKVGYIGVDIFAANTDSQFHKALTDLEKSKIDSLIIDLRGNTGGHLNVVTNMVSEFLDSSHIIYQIKSKENTEPVYSSGNTTKKYPIIILVNNGSASASELMSSALSEQYGAKLVGIKTFGKSTIQEVKDYTPNTEYKLTIKEWLTSKGVRLNKVGITPDYEVILSDKYIKNPSEANDNQLQKALELLTK